MNKHLLTSMMLSISLLGCSLAGTKTVEQAPKDTGPTETQLARWAAFEQVVFKQESLLNQEFDSLAAQTPGEVDLYVLLVAGDGRQQLFKKETDLVAEYLEQEMGLEHHIVTLQNAVQDIDQHPIAIRPSIEASLDRYAKVLGKEDILLIYLTSHGGGAPEHYFVLAQEGMVVFNFDRTWLAEVIDRSGIKYSIPIISACYSGGHIDTLSSDDRVVITAARADRSSFGCSDQNDMTYFGEAFFKHALDLDLNLSEMFDQSASVIADWEQQQELTPSEPQIAAGWRAMAQYEKWRTTALAERASKTETELAQAED